MGSKHRSHLSPYLAWAKAGQGWDVGSSAARHACEKEVAAHDDVCSNVSLKPLSRVCITICVSDIGMRAAVGKPNILARISQMAGCRRTKPSRLCRTYSSCQHRRQYSSACFVQAIGRATKGAWHPEHIRQAVWNGVCCGGTCQCQGNIGERRARLRPCSGSHLNPHVAAAVATSAD